jgi:hypothetical protein
MILGCLVLFLAPIVWAQEKVEAPVWNVGDKWTYKDVTGSTWTNEVKDSKEDLFIVKMGGIQDLYASDYEEIQDLYAFDKKTMNVKFLIGESGKRLKSRIRPGKILNFPMFVGKKWTDTNTKIPIGGSSEVTYLSEFKIESVETVTTLAGSFKAYKIYYKLTNMGYRGSSGWFRVWYAPDVKTWIKREVEKTGFFARAYELQDAELISYELK